MLIIVYEGDKTKAAKTEINYFKALSNIVALLRLKNISILKPMSINQFKEKLKNPKFVKNIENNTVIFIGDNDDGHKTSERIDEEIKDLKGKCNLTCINTIAGTKKGYNFEEFLNTHVKSSKYDFKNNEGEHKSKEDVLAFAWRKQHVNIMKKKEFEKRKELIIKLGKRKDGAYFVFWEICRIMKWS